MADRFPEIVFLFWRGEGNDRVLCCDTDITNLQHGDAVARYQLKTEHTVETVHHLTPPKKAKRKR